MDELPDYEIQRTVGDPGETAPPPQRPTGLWLVVALLIAAVGSATYIVFRRRPLPPPASNSLSKPHTVADAPPPRSLGGKEEQIAIPPLDQSDPVVRSVVRDLSSHPAVAKWLTGSGLVRDFAIVVARIADGTSPARFLTVLRPSLPFSTVEREGDVDIAPHSYERYAPIAGAVASIDPARAARLYATLKPRIQEAYRDLGFPPGLSLDQAIERAIVALLEVPIADEPVRLSPKGIGYAFADERLERLTGAQKQLLRMGPSNGRIIKEKLREIALALGIPSGELPSQ
jgi:Protein of unknown function (DUF3014)